MTVQGQSLPVTAENEAANAQPRFDETVLEDLAGDPEADRGFRASLVAIYLGTTPAAIVELRAAATRSDLDTVARLAHGLNSSSAQVGAMRLAAYAAALEVGARQGGLADPMPLATRLGSEFEALRPILSAIAGVPIPPAADTVPFESPAASPVSQALRPWPSMQTSQAITHAPRMLHALEAAARDQAPAARTLPNPARVLIIDDDVAMRSSIREVLAPEGYDIRVAAGGAEGLSVLADTRVDLIMLDLMMPGMDGFAVCRAVREIPGCEAVPVFVMTGMDDYRSVNAAYEAGATDFISKPVRWPVLLHRVRFLIRTGAHFRQLQRSEARNRAMLEAVPDTLLSLSRTGTFRTYKPGLNALPGLSGDDVGRKLAEALPGEIARMTLAAAQRALGRGHLESVECRVQDQGRERHFEARIVPSGKEEVIALLRDVTDQREHAENITRLAYYDALTGLPNRVLFEDRLAGAMAQAARNARRVALLFVDLDHFKSVNDSLGHKAGDDLLRHASRRLADCVRSSDSVTRIGLGDHVVSRWAGDEFTVMLTGLTDSGEASKVCARILERFREPFVIDGRHIYASVSAGIAVYPDDGVDPATLLRNADTAMYIAKSEGRDGFRHYSQSMSAQAMQRVDLVSRLQAAIEQGTLTLYYQPQRDLRTGEFVGAEALVRWADEKGEIVQPAKFIPLAEDTGLIESLGKWVLEMACRQAVAWRRAGLDLVIAVNVSARQLRRPGFTDDVTAVLSATGLPAERLEIELTETVLFQDDDLSVDVLRTLDRIGVRIALDDFGTGYASLTYLQRFPLDALKIDRSFVSQLRSSPGSEPIVRAIVAMAESLGLDVVAEGAETADQIALLASLGCAMVQGYGVARPLPADALDAMLHAGARRLATSASGSSPTDPALPARI